MTEHVIPGIAWAGFWLGLGIAVAGFFIASSMEYIGKGFPRKSGGL